MPLQSMRGGGHADVELTQARGFLDSRSYVRADGAEFLFGKDWQVRRRAIWERDGRRCVRCGALAPLDMCEIHHRIARGATSGHGIGDDRMENLECLFPAGCHRGKDGYHP